MGFRSTLITEHHSFTWPDWFKDKYSARFNLEDKGVLSSKYENKWNFIEEDIQKVLLEKQWDFELEFVLVYLHECGGITRVQFTKDGPKYSVPIDWEETDGIWHSYCYGCSDIVKFSKSTKENENQKLREQVQILESKLRENMRLNEKYHEMLFPQSKPNP